MFIPTRDASAMDLVCNTAGAGIGGLSAIAFDRTGLRASVSALAPPRVFRRPRRRPQGCALLAIWLLAQLNPGIPLFAATFDPSLELTRDLAGTLLQAAESAFNVIGVGLFLALLLRQRRFVGGAVLMLIGTALILKGAAASVLIRQSVLETWIKPGVSLGVAVGALVLLLAVWLPRPVRTTLCAISLLASLVAPLLAPDMWHARARRSLFSIGPTDSWLNFSGLTHAVLVAWPILASIYVRVGRRAAAVHADESDSARAYNFALHEPWIDYLDMTRGEQRPSIAGPSGRSRARAQSASNRRLAALHSVAHPHPLQGGTMDNKVVQTLAKTFAGPGLRQRSIQLSRRGGERRRVRRRRRRNR